MIVCYVVVGDRRRTRLFKKMKRLLPRVQKSVFEGEIPEDRLQPLREMIAKEIDQGEDTRRLYHLSGRCVPATEIIGTGVYVESEEDEVL